MGAQFVWSHRAPCLEGPHTRADALLLLLESSQHFLNLCLHLNLHLHFANYVTDPGLSLIISILTTHSTPLAALFAEEDSKVAYDMGAWVSEPEPSQRAPRAWELHLTGLTPRKFCFLGPWICTLLGSLSYPLPFLLGGVKPRPPTGLPEHLVPLSGTSQVLFCPRFHSPKRTRNSTSGQEHGGEWARCVGAIIARGTRASCGSQDWPPFFNLVGVGD